VVGLGLAIGTGFYVSILCGEMETKHDHSYRILYDLEIKTRNYYRSHHRLPASLYELSGEKSPNTDAWGWQITYTIISSNTARYVSLGAGGKTGGDNIVVQFTVGDPY